MDGGTEVVPSLWRSPAVRAVAAVTLLGFSGFFLTLASLPAYAVTGGAGQTTAGVVTTVFLAVTIAVQIVVPALTHRFGTGPVLVAGLLALGAPAPLYAFGDGLGWLCGLSAVRGAGFGVLTVLGSLLAAAVAPESRRGESLGIYGLAIAVPNLAAVPGGVALVLHGQVGWWAALSAAPLLALPLVPGLLRALPSGAGTPEDRGHAGRGARAALLPSAVLLVVTLAGGAVLTFLPIDRPTGVLATATLLVFGATGAVARWQAGVLADRIGTRLLLPGSVLAGGLGLLAIAAGLGVWGDAWVYVGAALFGVGYGGTQNVTLLASFARAGASGATSASSVWNASFDTGTAVGALAPGALAAGIGLPWTYVVITGALGLMLPFAVRATEVGRRRPAATG